jgi:hypothetical protein
MNKTTILTISIQGKREADIIFILTANMLFMLLKAQKVK